MSRIRVYFATRVRGFFRQFFSNEQINAEFIYSANQVFEENSFVHKILSKLIHNPLFDFLGVFQTIKCKDKNCDIYGSSNRFLKADRPYFIYTETPSALYHYSLNRNKTFLGKRNLIKALHNSNLKALIFMSNACKTTFEQGCASIPPRILTKTIYPYVRSNKNVSIDSIKIKCRSPAIHLLFSTQGEYFVIKGGLEILEAFKKIRNSGYNNISLIIITSIKKIRKKTLEDIKQTDGITLYDFGFNYQEMEHIYADSHILLHPTSQDSFGLTILEAVKAGLPVITTNLFAIPEFVQDSVNGFVTEPNYRFYETNNMPNPEIWNHIKKIIHSYTVSERIISFLYNSITTLSNDRDLLEKMSINSYTVAHSPPFDHDTITSQWNNVLARIAEL